MILFAIMIAAIFLVKGDGTQNNPTDTNGIDTQNPPVVIAPKYKCGMTVTSPLEGSTVSFPLPVQGGINNPAATDNCTWIMFEGMAGTVTISDMAGPQATVGLAVIGDWTGNVPVTFTGILNPPVVFAPGTPLTLTFNEEDPSGEGLNQTFSYQVIAQ